MLYVYMFLKYIYYVSKIKNNGYYLKIKNWYSIRI